MIAAADLRNPLLLPQPSPFCEFLRRAISCSLPRATPLRAQHSLSTLEGHSAPPTPQLILFYFLLSDDRTEALARLLPPGIERSRVDQS